MGHARKLLRWPLFLAALAACAPAPEPAPEPVATAVGAATTSEPPPCSPTATPISTIRPAVPALLRDVHLIEQAADEDFRPTGPVSYLSPIIPPFRTSADGRIGVDMASHKLFLLAPEALTEPVTDPVWDGNPDGAPTGPVIVYQELAAAPDTTFYDPDEYMLPSLEIAKVSLAHQTICDPTPELGFGPLTRLNPHPCDPNHPTHPDPALSFPTEDCYSLKMFSVVEIPDGEPCSTSDDCLAPETCVEEACTSPHGVGRVQYWSKSFTAIVSNPKRDGSGLKPKMRVSFSPDPPVHGPIFHADVSQDPSITADGRLLVLKLGQSRWDPNTGEPRGDLDSLDIVYSTYSELSPPCDVTKWTTLHPISHAHIDSAMIGRYGIAAHKIRDPQGHLVEDGEDLRVSYPWIDRAGDNIFFTALQATLFSQDQACGMIERRYEERCLPGAPHCRPDPTDWETLRDFEELQNFRGVGVVGEWTHGKMVLLDSAINNIDYGLGRTDADQRELCLYTKPNGECRWIRAGTGKYPGGPAPEKSTGNTAFIDSIEHRFNWNENMKPLTLRDVVWILNTGKGSAELVFDDYVDPNALLFAEMSGALQHTTGGTVASRESLKYYDGFNQVAPGTIDKSGTRQVRFQNAAASTAWDLPRFGAANGDVRLEPVALGGVEGKGAWLDGDGDSISFDIPDQSEADPPKIISDHAFYLGVFIDSRFTDDGLRRQLVTFGSGDKINIVGRSSIEYQEADGDIRDSTDVSALIHPTGGPDALQSLGAFDVTPGAGAWSHLAFVLDYPLNRTRLYVNGYLKRSTVGVFPLAGTLRIGDAPGDSTPGFTGWIDEVKLLAYHPTPELACNHARGTLMQVSPQSGAWLTLAQSYPQTAHNTISDALDVAHGPTYVCYHKYRDHRLANPRFVPAALGLTSIREQLNFPEGPLEFDLVRPATTTNKFCLSCHHVNGVGGLDLDALLQGTVPLQADPRRQPMMAPPWMFGNVPQGLFGSGPSSDQSTRMHSVDQYVFPSSP